MKGDEADQWDSIRRVSPWIDCEIHCDPTGKPKTMRLSWRLAPWDAYLDALRSVPHDDMVLAGLATWIVPIEGQPIDVKIGLKDLVEPGETVADVARRLQRDMIWDQDSYTARHR